MDEAAGSAVRAMSIATGRVHASLDVGQTLDTIARGVTDVTVFSVAAVNMRRADGSYETVAVAAGAEARDALLGQVGSAELWRELMADSSAWGELRFIHHDDALATDDSVPSWRPPLPETDDETAWHPDDILFAPLISQPGELIGMLSVDLPRDGRLPGPQQQELLTLFAQHAAIAIERAMLHAELQHSRDLLAHAAAHDPLTGLHNRSVLATRGPELAERPGTQVAVIMLDLNRFKQLNDTLGHAAGDQLLTVIGRRLISHTREHDLVLRLGGDEFAILATYPHHADVPPLLTDLVTRLDTAITAPVHLQHGTHTVGVSIGTAFAPTPTDLDHLLQQADTAMYHHKNQGHRV